MPTVGGSERETVGPGGAPPWVVRPWDERLSFFQLVGTTEDASPEEIEKALEAQLRAVGMQVELLPPGVEYAACFLLANDRQRELYRRLLQHCHTGQPFDVEADRHQATFNFAELTRLKCWRDPERPNDFHFRQLGQTPPAFVLKALEKEEARRREADHVADKRRWQDRHEQQATKRLFLRFAYAFGGLLLLGVTGYMLFDGAFPRGMRVVGALDERESKHLETEGREGLAVATDAVSQLSAALVSLREDVQRDLGTSLDTEGKVPEDVQAAISREPTVAEAWRNVQAAYRERSELEHRQSTLKAIGTRIREKNFLKADVESLREIKAWAARALTNATSQTKNVDHIRAVLEIERFRRVGNTVPKEP